MAFRRYAGIRATYLQTVRALAKVTEIGGYVEPGHSERVSQLAVAVGRELGIHEPELLELEYAALMHDIGQLSLTDPIPGGATVLAAPHEQRRIAELGAEVIQQAQVLGSVAEIVRRQNEPYRGIEVAHEGRGRHAAVSRPASPSGPPLSSRIIKAANAFDDLVGSSMDPDRAAAAVQQLRLEHGQRVRPGHGRGPQPRSEPPLGHPALTPSLGPALPLPRATVPIARPSAPPPASAPHLPQ